MRETVFLRSDGVQRRYALVAPAASGAPDSNASPSRRLPLVIELHGRGIDAVRFDLWTGIATLGERAGFVTAMPWALDGIWNDGRFDAPAIAAVDDVAFIEAVVGDVATRIPIDPARVYVVGMSNGATMTARLACERPELFAAIAQVAGTAGVDVARRGRPDVARHAPAGAASSGSAGVSPPGSADAALPVLHVHGTADRFAPYDGGVVHGIGARLLLGRRRAGPVLGVDEWARFWVERDGDLLPPTEERLPPDVTVRRWSGSTPASDVVFYRVDGGGHTWPGQRTWTPPHLGRRTPTIDATSLILAFFQQHVRPPGPRGSEPG